jgi:hypothetical protein
VSIILPAWVAKREQLRAEREAQAERNKPKPPMNLDISDKPGHLEKFCEAKPELRSKLFNIIEKVMLHGEHYSHGAIAYDEFRGVLSEGEYPWAEWT